MAACCHSSRLEKKTHGLIMRGKGDRQNYNFRGSIQRAIRSVSLSIAQTGFHVDNCWSCRELTSQTSGLESQRLTRYHPLPHWCNCSTIFSVNTIIMLVIIESFFESLAVLALVCISVQALSHGEALHLADFTLMFETPGISSFLLKLLC